VVTGGGAAPGSSFVGSWLGVVRRRWRAGLLVFLLVTGGTIALILLSRPIYRSEARLRLGEPPPMGGVSPTGGLFSLMRLGGDPFAKVGRASCRGRGVLRAVRAARVERWD